MTVTNHMVRKLLADVSIETRNGVRGISSIQPSDGDTIGSVFVNEKKITKVHGDFLVAEDGTKAKLLAPFPCFKWVCLGVTNNTGWIVLNKPFKALILSDGENNYCLGVDGVTDEFELTIEVGKNKISINNQFINIQAEHEIKNGVER